MQKMKKQKVQEILDAQNAAIEADMVRITVITLLNYFFLCVIIYDTVVKYNTLIYNIIQNNRGKGRLKYLLQQTELFAHFAKGDQSSSQKKSRGGYISKIHAYYTMPS